MESLKPSVFINQIASVVPDTEFHEMFKVEGPKFLSTERKKKLFAKMEAKGKINKRYTVLPKTETEAGPGLLDFYKKEEFPSTSERMRRYKHHAFPLVKKAVEKLKRKEDISGVTHLIVTSCTGFYAPGIDIDIVREFELSPSVERTVIGFMGCYAAFNAMKQAKSIAQADRDAKVLIVNVELCTLHFQDRDDLEAMLGFLIFADGCTASLVTSEERGLELVDTQSFLCFDEKEKITWDIGDQGFDMFLSTDVPKAVTRELAKISNEIINDDVNLWAIHPGGRSVLDSVQRSLEISDEGMQPSREVLSDYGNMSSSTVMFVLEKHLRDIRSQGMGMAMAFGPGLTIESLRFKKRPL